VLAADVPLLALLLFTAQHHCPFCKWCFTNLDCDCDWEAEPHIWNPWFRSANSLCI